MSIAWSAEQEELRKVVRQFCENRSSEDDVRALMDSEAGFDPDVWTQMATQLGLQGATIPEAYGGSGFSQLELTLVFEELGRSLMCAPYLGTVGFAAPLLEATGNDAACERWLPGIASGDLVVGVAHQGDRPTGREVSPEVQASRSADGWRLDGASSFVIDGASADLLLVVARDGADPMIFAVDPAQPGVTRTAQPTVDRTRRFARVLLDGCPGEPVETARDPRTVLGDALDRAAINLAAEQVGGAQRMLDLSVEYAKLRQQFGRPIGSFQAIKHKCADMLLEVEGARSAAYHAAKCVANGSPDVPWVAAVAKAAATEAYLRVTADTIQIHGGVGFTWEHPAHLYYKRALSSEHLFGDASSHREALVQLLETTDAAGARS
jgi:alkylation response protein AidB-like acyl-CoA dehydrogenase